MKLEKSARLVFAEGRTEKVYEVDLCEVGAGQFVVNFRYGKRGAPLKDGSKTVAPVSRAEAEKVYQKLIDQKIEQGYLPEGAARPTPPVAPAPPLPTRGEQDARAHRILERLGTAGSARRFFRRPEHDRTWNLERAIWRAGELRLRDAERLLLALIGTAPANAPREAGGKGLRDYCIAWALGRLGTAASIPALTTLSADTKADAAVRRMAALSLLELSDEPARAALRRQWIEWLPDSLRESARGDDPAAFGAALAAHLALAPANWAAVELAYVIDSETVRPAVLEQLRVVPLTSPFFYWVRHIFKAAEQRLDAEVFGILAHRFATTRANFAHRNYQGQSAYGGHTRRYLQWRTFRALRRIGALGDLDYVKMAVGVLLPFSDRDAQFAKPGYGPWAPYWALNQILYGRSPRYETSPSRKTFRLKKGQRSVELDYPAREESFPRLWEQRPEGLMHLLVESACAPVHAFAAKAIRAVPAFLQQLDVDDVVLLLSRPYPQTARLAYELALDRWNALEPNFALLLGLAVSPHPPARAKAIEWTDSVREKALGESAFLAGLVLAPFEDTRAFARRLLRAQRLPRPLGGALIARVVAGMLVLEDDAIARDATATLLAALAEHLEDVQPAVIRDLVSHPLAGVQELGAELLLRQRELVPDDVFIAVLHSQHENVRAVGLRLLAELSDEKLANLELLLVRLTTDRNVDLRSAARPLIRRVAASNAVSAETIARGLIEALLRRKLPEGAPSHVLSVLRLDLFTFVAALPDDDVYRLLHSQSAHAQELGGLLLQNIEPKRVPLERAAVLASHDVLAVRQAAWRVYEHSLDRVREGVAEASKILDAKWEDSRRFAFDFFREKLGAEAFDAGVLVTILDSTREDVQAFGRELTTRYFREEDGPVLMTRLAEHPTVAVQLYTTNYLERFATGRPERVEAMIPFFTTVLSRPNQGRVAKRRVLSFLEREGVRDADAAPKIIELLHRVSATMAVEARGAAVAAMVGIHRAHPALSVPFRYKTPELRGGDGVLVRV